MGPIFVVCAAVGGTILVLQFVMMLIGLGGEAMDIDMPQDIGHDFGGDLHGDVGGDVGGDFHAGGDLHGGAGGDADQGGHVTADHHVSSSWLFGVISLRTVVAALTFFGLAGLATRSANVGPIGQLTVGVLAGLAALYGVYFMMLGLRKLKAEGTPRIGRAVGLHGTVYTSIPAEESGSGKIQLNLQNRTMEYLAMTTGHALSPGTKVVVTDIITSDTVQVEPVLETEERNGHV
jgi:hypothetical protein